jgi:hypothetical protein
MQRDEIVLFDDRPSPAAFRTAQLSPIARSALVVDVMIGIPRPGCCGDPAQTAMFSPYFRTAHLSIIAKSALIIDVLNRTLTPLETPGLHHIN